jgi:hypothetical protein
VKTTTLLLALSLAANAALAVFLTKSSSPASKLVTPTSIAPASSSSRPTDKNTDALRAALASGDIAALQAAGFSADEARDIVLGRSIARILARAKAQHSATNDRWWINKRPGSASREEDLKNRREFSDALIAAFGEDPIFGGGGDSNFAFLSPEKRAALRRITQDYDELMAKFGGDGIQLASDREKLKMLRAERDRDIAALLNPEERLAYEMRTSSSGAAVRARYGDGITSEEEFAKIYELQKAFDEKFSRESMGGRISPETLRARTDAERQLQNDVRAAVGEDRYAALRRASDPEIRTLDALAARLNLPSSTTDSILASRDTYAAESQRINADASLTPQQRRAQLLDLGNRAKSEIASTLGTEAADAYAQRSPWMSMLQGGLAFSTTPPTSGPSSLGVGNQSVYPVVPANAATAGGGRQVVSFGTVTDGGPAPADAFFLGATPIARGENIQVMSFATGEIAVPPPGSAPAATTMQRVGPNGSTNVSSPNSSPAAAPKQ